jgi:hypothetical protein
MADFTEDLRNEDPALLHRLRTMLRAPGAAPHPRPTCEERFGVPASGREAPADGTVVHPEPVLAGPPSPRLRGEG